jgi:hypothetical protein
MTMGRSLSVRLENSSRVPRCISIPPRKLESSHLSESYYDERRMRFEYSSYCSYPPRNCLTVRPPVRRIRIAPTRSINSRISLDPWITLLSPFGTMMRPSQTDLRQGHSASPGQSIIQLLNFNPCDNYSTVIIVNTRKDLGLTLHLVTSSSPGRIKCLTAHPSSYTGSIISQKNSIETFLHS